ncbi:MAG: hypothetical protein ACRDJ4_09505 [Actinomycetota bacterium]
MIYRIDGERRTVVIEAIPHRGGRLPTTMTSRADVPIAGAGFVVAR